MCDEIQELCEARESLHFWQDKCEHWQQEYEELACAIRGCTLSELEHDHEATLKLAVRGAKAVRLREKDRKKLRQNAARIQELEKVVAGHEAAIKRRLDLARAHLEDSAERTRQAYADD